MLDIVTIAYSLVRMPTFVSFYSLVVSRPDGEDAQPLTAELVTVPLDY